jgi:hypothetical protein
MRTWRIGAKGYAQDATAGPAASIRGMTEDFVLTGERAALGPLRREHLPSFARWTYDPEVRRGLAYRGLARAELGIFLGRRRGTGIGSGAVRLALDWAFNMLGRRWDSFLMDATAEGFDSPVLAGLRP